MEDLIKALEFYANPETYFAIGLFPDFPCGKFINDIGICTLNGVKTKKPGALARKTLKKYYLRKLKEEHGRE